MVVSLNHNWRRESLTHATLDGRSEIAINSLNRLPPTTNQMKLYLITTGALFVLLAFAHLLRTIAEWSRLNTDPWFYLEGPGIGILAAALCFWAWRLLRVIGRS